MLRVDDLSLHRGGSCLCRKLQLRVEPGQIWALLGTNGIGKSTLLHSLAGLLPTPRETIHLQGKPLGDYSRRELARRLGLLFQHQEDPFPLTVRETAEQSVFPHHALWQSPPADRLQRIDQVLEDLQLTALGGRDIRTLSGGERQRLALAGLLIQSPALWLLDEPTNHLDIPHQIRLLDTLSAIARQGRTGMLIALHDVNQAQRLASHVLLMLEQGRWLAGSRADMLTAGHLQQVYGCPFRRLYDPQSGASCWQAI